MVTKQVLNQYRDLQQECEEIRDKVVKLDSEIKKLDLRIREIESGETVKDKVLGGEGGKQPFNIEGVPVKEYEQKKTELLTKKLLLHQRKSTLEILEFQLLEKTNEVEEFIANLDDSRMRRIIDLKFIHNLSWLQVANRIGGGNTESGVKMTFHRFMEKD